MTSCQDSAGNHRGRCGACDMAPGTRLVVRQPTLQERRAADVQAELFAYEWGRDHFVDEFCHWQLCDDTFVSDCGHG